MESNLSVKILRQMMGVETAQELAEVMGAA
ncbi:MAG: hypothetical protein P8048_10005 [Calditrichia bacterium]